MEYRFAVYKVKAVKKGDCFKDLDARRGYDRIVRVLDIANNYYPGNGTRTALVEHITTGRISHISVKRLQNPSRFAKVFITRKR